MPVSGPESQPGLPGSDTATSAAIYVHWPFCEKKCPYCDFNSHVRDHVDQQVWQKAMLQEIATFAAHFPNLKASSIFFGGGTPSLMPPDTTNAIIDEIKKYWQPDDDIEITLEANPSSVEASRFAAYAQAGVNRVSLGVQSFNDSSLKFLGRLHSAQEALAALDVAQDNFARVSNDLIYALPHQSREEWQAELQQALEFSPSHLSLYQLTIEEGTAFYHQFRRGRFSLPNEDEAAALFELTQGITQAAGLPAYETSNHAKPGEESRHNLAYWQGLPYVGIGPGAHGRLPGPATGTAYAHFQIKRPEDWVLAVQSRRVGLAEVDLIDRDDRAVEAIMMGLRLARGIERETFRHRFGQDLMAYIDLENLEDLIEQGYVNSFRSSLSLTGKGSPLLNFLLPKILK